MSTPVRRLCALITVVFVFVMLFAACGADNKTVKEDAGKEEATQPESTPQETQEEAKPELEPYELSWYFINDKPQDNDMVQAEVSKYLTEKINATIKLNPLGWDDYGQKVDLMLAAGEPFDICFSSSWMNFYPNVAKGAFIEISELLEKYGQDLKKVEDPGFWPGATVSGKLYGIPVNKEMAHAYGYLYNKDIADKHGIDMSAVKSDFDLDQILKQMKEKEPEMIAVSPPSPNFTLNYSLISFPLALENITNDFKIFNMYEKPEAVDLVKLHRKWYLNGYIPKDISTLDEGSIWNLYYSGKLFALGASLKPGKDAEEQPACQFKVGQVMFKSVVQTSDINSSIVCISKTSKNPERAMMCLNLVNSDPYLFNLITLGIENTHWVKTADGRWDLAESQKGEGKQTYNAPAWELGNNFLCYIGVNEDPMKWENFKKFNQESELSNTLGFVFEVESVKNEIAAVKNVQAVYKGLDQGSIDPDKAIPEFIKKMKDAGLDKIQEEAQKQLDQWIETNKK